jgi:hypothetical protein
MQFIQGDGKNQTFVRYYLPPSAELIGSGAQLDGEKP